MFSGTEGDIFMNTVDLKDLASDDAVKIYVPKSFSSKADAELPENDEVKIYSSKKESFGNCAD